MRAGRRRSRRLLLASTALSAALLATARAAPPAPSATPQGGSVVGGSAAIAQAPGSTTITQTSQRAAIDWQSFNVGANARVTFKQPNAQAIALNRVMSENPSIIAGRIDANGQIVLMNQSGVVFAAGSQVNAESLVVSTSGISAKNFMAGKMLFDEPPKPGARIVNDGRITMKQAGLAAFVAPQVVNRGTITATLGHVVLAGASAFTLNLSGDGLISINVTQAVRQVDLGGRKVTALVTNQGTIVANGGTVTLTAQAVDGLIQQLLGVGGTIKADSVGASKGAITIQGIGGDLTVSGQLLARGTAPGSTGGTIAVDATGNVGIAGTARLDASGAAGGGVIALGTDAARAVQGPLDKAAPLARSVSIAQGAKIRADATADGSGGRIVMDSRQRTDQGGAVSAQGAGNGAGGRIEVSSEGVISLSGTETVFAPHGDGEILLDPATLIVGPSGSNSAVTYIDPTALDAMTGAVDLTASSQLAVEAAISSSSIAALSLISGGDLTIAAPISLTGALEISADGALTIGSNLTAPTISLADTGAASGDIEIGGVVNAGTLLALAADHAVRETTGGYIDAPTLVSTGTIGGDVLLNQAPGAAGQNDIATLGSFATDGTLAISNLGTGGTAAPLTVTGSVSAKDATLTAGGITIDAPLSATSTLALTSIGAGGADDGAITQSAAGIVTAGTLMGAAGTVGLDQAANAVNTLGTFTATGYFALKDSGPLAVTGPFSAANATLTANGITIGGGVTSQGTLALGGGGTIAEIAGGVISTPMLLGNGSIGGDLILGNTLNQIGTLGSIAAGGTLLVADGEALDVAAALSAGTVGLIDTGALTLGGTIVVGSGGAIDLVADTLAATATATLSAPTGTIAIAPYSSGRPLDFGGSNSQALAIAASFAAAMAGDGEEELDLGRVAADGATFQAPTVTIEGALAAFAHTLVVTATDAIVNSTSLAAGAITLAGGAITNTGTFAAGTLAFSGSRFDSTGAVVATSVSGSVTGDATLSGTANAVGTVASLTAGSSMLLDDGAGQTLTLGTLALSAPGTIAIAADGIALAAGGTIADAGGVVSLAPATDTSVALGTGPAVALVLGSGLLNAIGAATLIAGDTAAALSTGGSLGIGAGIGTVVLVGDGIDIGGSFSVANGLSLASGGTIQSATGIAAQVLAGQAGGAAQFLGNNAIGTLDGFDATGQSFALDDGTALTIAGTLVAGTAALSGTEIAIPGDVTASLLELGATGSVAGAGTIAAGTLSSLGTIGGDAALTGTANTIGTIAGFTVAGNATIDDAGSLAVDGLQAANATLAATSLSLTSIATGRLSLSTAGGIAGSAVDAATLAGSAGSSVSLAGSIATLGDFTAAAITLDDTAALAIAGTVSVAGALAFGGAGGITETGSIIAATLASDGAIGGDVSLGGANNVATLGAFDDAGHAFALNDTGSLTVAGPLTGATVALGASDLAISGSIAATLLSLAATGTIGETGSISAATLTGTAGTLAALTGTNNIATLGDFAGGGLVLTDAEALAIAGSVSLAGGFDLGDAAGITETGTIVAATLASSGTIGGDVALTGSNTIAALGDFADTGHAFALNDTISLAVAGSLGADTVMLSAPGIGIGGTIAANLVSFQSGGGVTGGGTVDAATLAGSAASLALTGANSIAMLGSLVVTGSATLADTAPLTIAGPVSAAILALGDTGGISETGSLDIGTLASFGTIGGDVALAGANTIGALGDFTVAGNATIADATSLAVIGNVAVGGALALAVNGGIGETGAIAAGTLTSVGAIGGDVSLGGANTIATLGAFDEAGHAFTLHDTGTLTVAGSLDAATVMLGGTDIAIPGTVAATLVSLAASGGITETGAIDATTLAGTVGTVAALTGGNTIGTLGDFTGGSVTLADAAPLIVGGAVSLSGDLALGVAGAISETGAIDAGTLSSVGAIGGNVSLAGANSIATLAGFDDAGFGFALNDNAPLTVAGLQAATAMLDAAAIAIPGSIAATVVTLVTAGSVSGAGTIATTTLTTAGTIGGGVALTGANAIGTIAGFAAAGDVAVNDTGALTVVGLHAANATLSAAALALSGVSTGRLSLVASGTIAGSGIDAATLAGSGGSLVSLAGTIGTLGGFTAGGTMTLDDAGALAVTGPVSVASVLTLDAVGGIAGTGAVDAGTLNAVAPSLALTGANSIATLGSLAIAGGATLNDDAPLTIAGPVSAAILALGDAGAIIETGAIDVGTLASFGTIGGDVALTGNNTIAALGDFAAAGNATLTDTAPLTIAGAVDIGGLLELGDPGAITETGSIAAATLASDGTIGGNVALTGANHIGTLAGFAAAGDVTLADAGLLVVNGLVAANATLSAGDFAITGGIATGLLSLSTPGTIVGAGAIDATTLTGSAGTLAALTGANRIGTLGNFTAGNLTLDNAAPLDIGGAVSVAGGLALGVAGAITETGSIAAATFASDGTLGGDLGLTGTNTIATLGAVNDGGFTFALADTAPLTVAGNVTAGTMNLAAAAIALPGTIAATLVSLASAGAIAGTGAVDAATFTGSAASLTLTGANTIATLAALAITADAALNDHGPLVIAGPVGASTFALGDDGAVIEPGAITAATLESLGTIGGDIALAGANRIGTLGDFFAGGDFTIADNIPLDIAGLLEVKALLEIGDAGVLGETGSITAGTLASLGTIGGNVALTGDNHIGTLAGFFAVGDAAIDNAGLLAVNGLGAANVTLAAGALAIDGGIATGLLSLSTPGTVAGAGIVQAAMLTGNAASLALTGANTIGTLGNFSAGNLTLDDATSLAIGGAVSISGALALGVAGGISESGAIDAATLAGIGTAGGDVALTGANQIGTLAGFDDAGHAFTLNDLAFLTVAGPLTAGTVGLDAAGIALPGTIAATLVSLVSPDAIAGAGAVDAATLAGSAASLSLIGANRIGTLGALAVTTDAALNDTAPLTIAGPLTAERLALGGVGDIIETGSIAAATLTSLGTIGGDVALTGNNTIATLGDFAAVGNVTLADHGALDLVGPFAAANATLAADAIAIPGSVHAGMFSLASAGAIAGSGAIDAATIAGSAGSLALTGTNHIATVGSFTVVGPATIDSATTLTIAGPLRALDIALDALRLLIPGTVATPGTLALGARDGIAASGSVSAATLASLGTIGGDAAFTGTDFISVLGDFAALGAVTLNDAEALAVRGTLAAGSATISPQALDIPGAIKVSGTLSLASGGTIGEAGAIDARLLDGRSAGNALLTGDNAIGTLGGFGVAAGAFDLLDGSPLTVIGPLDAPEATLSATALDIAGQVSTGTLALGGGAIVETGQIAAGVLDSVGRIGGDVNLSGVNRIGTLAGFDVAGHALTLRDAGSLTVAGPVAARVVTLAATGQMVLAAGGSLLIDGAALPAIPVVSPTPRTGVDSVLSVTGGGAQALLQNGGFHVDTGALAGGFAGQPNTLFVVLSNGGGASFAGLDAPATTLVLDLDNGMANGQVNLHYLLVYGSTAGRVNLFGTINGLGGQAAAHNAKVVPLPGSAYRFNTCVIGSVNCTVLPIIALPQRNPLQDFDLTPDRRRHLSADVRLPNVAARDY